MEHREQIQNIDQINKAIALAIDIQNAGIATAFAHFSGHINGLEIQLHTPKWIPNVSADISIRISGKNDEDTRDFNEENIIKLETILTIGGNSESEEIAIIQSKEKQQRREQFELLKQEFEAA